MVVSGLPLSPHRLLVKICGFVFAYSPSTNYDLLSRLDN